ncbi:MAG: hypothetical protein J2P18_01690, partial [Nocardia sp.]|nr:hypothetical protein [Nocardia sp.]
MSLHLPEGLRWLGWIAGAEWPDGDEDKMWAISRAWEQAANDLAPLTADIEAAKKAAMDAYPAGDGQVQIGKLFDVFLVGDQSLPSLIDSYKKVSESTFDVGTELQATKLSIIVSLALLAVEIMWAWMFPPTAPEVESAAIGTTRSWMKIIGDTLQNAMERAWSKLGFATRAELRDMFGTANRYYWKNLAEYIVNKGAGAQLRGKGPGAAFKYGFLPTAKGMGVYTVKFGEAAMWGPITNATVQGGQIAQGKRHGFDWKSFGAAGAGAALGTIPSREFGRGVGGVFRTFDEKWGGKIASSPYRIGPIGVGVVTGSSSAVFGNIFANLGVAAVTGDPAGTFASAPGWVGAASRGGIVGGSRGASTKMTGSSANDPRFGAWMHNKADIKDSFNVSTKKFFNGQNWNSPAKGGSTNNIEMNTLSPGGSTNSGTSGTNSGGSGGHVASGGNSAGNGGHVVSSGAGVSSSSTGGAFGTNGHGFVHSAGSGSGAGGNHGGAPVMSGGRGPGTDGGAPVMSGGRGQGFGSGPGGSGGGIGLRGGGGSDDGTSSFVSHDGSNSSGYRPSPSPS